LLKEESKSEKLGTPDDPVVEVLSPWEDKGMKKTKELYR
jgi:hypothetical protein